MDDEERKRLELCLAINRERKKYEKVRLWLPVSAGLPFGYLLGSLFSHLLSGGKIYHTWSNILISLIIYLTAFLPAFLYLRLRYTKRVEKNLNVIYLRKRPEISWIKY